jgi:uncharacterized protein
MVDAPDASGRHLLRRIDGHVHLLGVGAGGTGCTLRPDGWRRLISGYMLRQIGMKPATLKGDFDRLYVENLLRLLRESRLDGLLVLAQDHAYRADGERIETGIFHVPNAYALQIGRQHPELIPAVSIHPGRPDALDELERCLERGAAALKLLPNCLHVDYDEPRYARFWERMAEAGLPLLTHTGGETMLPQTEPRFADPVKLQAPLRAGVTVIAAHCATRDQPFGRCSFDAFVEMLEQYPNLYGDTSAMTLPFRSYALRRCLQSGIRERLVHGSDFPIPSPVLFVRARGLIDGVTCRTARAMKNPLERDRYLKAALGFPEEHFTRINHLLRWPGRASSAADAANHRRVG